MNGKFIMLSGSAGLSCHADKLDIAFRFIRGFTGEVLRRGGGLVVLAGDEESTKDERGVPHVFDWLVLREVEDYAENTTEMPRPYARVIMSDKAPESKIDDDNLRLLRNLEQRNVIELCPIRREVFTGGEYRRVMIERADAMLAIGGGKGTYSAGTDMIALGKPVLPLDLQLGSAVDDGDGAVALHREMVSAPSRFFPNTHHDMRNRVGLLSLDRGINDADTVARVSAEMLANEFDAIPLPDQSTSIWRRVAAAWQATKALPNIASAIKIIEWIRGLLPFV
ncbi:MAG: hypothetical protein F4W95_14445 [Chloroflexi bacterium]|nr:hypothetical protein [Chloroflexota bacterium]MYD49661.1 hypothetical protein [Chloroflexota bacterium]